MLPHDKESGLHLNVMRHGQDMCVCEDTKHGIYRFKIYSSMTLTISTLLEEFSSRGVKPCDEVLENSGR